MCQSDGIFEHGSGVRYQPFETLRRGGGGGGGRVCKYIFLKTGYFVFEIQKEITF